MSTIKLSNVSCAQMRRILKCAGFSYSHTNGDHEIWTKAGALRPCVIPISQKPLAEFIVRNLINTAGMTTDEAKAILSKGKLQKK